MDQNIVSSKWADYVITGVRYNASHSSISEVEVRADNGETIGAPRLVTRQQMISAIVGGESAVTAFRRDTKWHKGEDVRVATINGVRYLRTDRNSTSADNLGNLPEV